MKRLWKFQKVADQAIQQLTANGDISPLLAKLLAIRGIDTASSAKAYLSPAEHSIPSPFLFNEMQPAVERIQQAIERKERVLIYGDYDADGITASCIMLQTLSALGLEAEYFLPDRMKDGYGLQTQTVLDNASSFDLLITVDCGTSSVEAVKAANHAGLDVIITDHHSPGDERPPAIALINPIQHGEQYPSKNLAGAGVAWKLASALFEAQSRSGEENRLLDLVALGTVADVVSIVGENRTLLTRAFDGFKSMKRPGLMALMDLAKVIPSHIGTQEIGFRIGPRINAAGRMEHPRLALELLLTNDETHAKELAQYLSQLNTKRQSVETKILKEAVDFIESKTLLDRSGRVLVVAGENWHLGVLGIVAARLVQKYQRPTFLLSRIEEKYVGSARSVDGVNLIPLLDAARPHSISCGGHAGAAGMKVTPDNLEGFINSIYDAVDHLEFPSEPAPLLLDAKLPLEQIDAAFMSEMQRMEPFGEGNEEPVFYSPAKISGMGARIVGNNHLRLNLQHQRGTITAIGFGLGDKLETLQSGDVELAFCCRWNEYNGRRSIDLHLKDVRPASSASSGASPEISIKEQIWNRELLGKIYVLLEKSCNDKRIIVRQNTGVLAQMVKISQADFDKALTIFSEIDLLTIDNGNIVIHEAKKKSRQLTDSKTYRLLTEKK